MTLYVILAKLSIRSVITCIYNSFYVKINKLKIRKVWLFVMGISVKLEAFEGPLDLLLHLIDKNKVNIYDIPIADITEQYMEYVRKMQEENLDIVSEFLVMAATLLDIKCRMLLPKEVDEEGNEEDPRAELVEQLLEYKLFKAMAEELKGQQLDALKTYYRKPLTYQKRLVDILHLSI